MEFDFRDTCLQTNDSANVKWIILQSVKDSDSAQVREEMKQGKG